jgi:dTDP-L-rhamnose 4-epimerase
MRTVLITGGAGFIGTHLAESLLDNAYKVIILDNLSPQVHGEIDSVPDRLRGRVHFIKGDILDSSIVYEAVSECDFIIHLVAETGVGQSMYEIRRYTDININGSAILLEAIISNKQTIKKAILASSRAVYGEGKYECSVCGITHGRRGTDVELSRRQWHMSCTQCGSVAGQLPTDELFPPKPTSIYGITKLAQEQLFGVVGRSYGIPTVILRYFNVYGPGQSLGNPYTGILSIFTSMILNGKAPPVYEDGMESRDFVYLEDAVNATMLALEKDEANNKIYNVGSGTSVTVWEIAKMLVEKLGAQMEPVINGMYRVGDIRHCFADIALIRNELGYKPMTDIDVGIAKFTHWAQTQKNVIDLSDSASSELNSKGLLRKTE